MSRVLATDVGIRRKDMYFRYFVGWRDLSKNYLYFWGQVPVPSARAPRNAPQLPVQYSSKYTKNGSGSPRSSNSVLRNVSEAEEQRASSLPEGEHLGSDSVRRWVPKASWQ